MASDSGPQLRSTGVVENLDNHEEVIGLKLSYIYNECFFAILLSHELPQGGNADVPSDFDNCIVRDLIHRFNEACTWTEKDKTIEDVDARLDKIWREAEDMVRDTAFDKIRCLGLEYGREPQAEEIVDRSQNLLDYLFPKSFNLQLIPHDKTMIAVERPDLPQCLPFAIETNILPTSAPMSVTPESMYILKCYRPHVLKVQIEGNVFCCKLNNTGAQDSLLREYETLLRIRNSSLRGKIRVPELKGVVEIQGGVVGLLIDWIETEESNLLESPRLRDAIPEPVKHNWTTELTQTLAQLHSLGLIWGDAKADNVLVDKCSKPWLVDFGGGFTEGWVDETLCGTQAGDLQGLENTFLHIFGRKE